MVLAVFLGLLLACVHNDLSEASPARFKADSAFNFKFPGFGFEHQNIRLPSRIESDQSKASYKPVVYETDSCKCGRLPSSRIVGGSKAVSGEWCWQAKVMVWSKDDDGSFFLCGGSIINDEYILTAAHCFYGMDISKVDVYVGAYKLYRDTEGRRENVDSILMHPRYDPKTKANDIALMKMARKIKYSDRVCSVCLPTKKVDYTGEPAVITGWGALESEGDSPSALMQAVVNVVSNEKCRKQYGYLDPSQICASAPGVDSCQVYTQMCTNSYHGFTKILREECTVQDSDGLDLLLTTCKSYFGAIKVQKCTKIRIK
ncbi:hypothetical protein J437_LFUL005190 [Ladona fulva]|uniref:Peptidase S1 domain-containing protein n=1 Tax=Ladona fulva TaxID=123851 RepID=A0A8K0KMM7_LADFU|nr:hypothetical protein J437_LFUL005190 [Ladona fulva]